MGTLSKKLCAKFGHACVHLVWVGGWVCSISQLSSWPPYAELGAQAGSICQVNAQPQPQAAGPYKPHYSRNHAGTHNHTSWTHIDMCSERRTHLIKPKVYHTMAKSPGVGKAFLKFIMAVWTGVRWMFPTLIHYIQWSRKQRGEIPINREERRVMKKGRDTELAKYME